MRRNKYFHVEIKFFKAYYLFFGKPKVDNSDVETRLFCLPSAQAVADRNNII